MLQNIQHGTETQIEMLVYGYTNKKVKKSRTTYDLRLQNTRKNSH